MKWKRNMIGTAMGRVPEPPLQLMDTLLSNVLNDHRFINDLIHKIWEDEERTEPYTEALWPES